MEMIVTFDEHSGIWSTFGPYKNAEQRNAALRVLIENGYGDGNESEDARSKLNSWIKFGCRQHSLRLHDGFTISIAEHAGQV